ncbi:MAG: rRNA maturation RNase YbeY [Maribacter sp.]|uniref:rRNA maturation RNase YbeY n=1 Tax=Maribacter sp. TaxID=1897614 RepID=UPI00329826B9
MISFNYVSDYQLVNSESYVDWLAKVVASEAKLLGDIAYIFCDDTYLLKVNQEFLQHDTFTDIITFDYSNGNTIAGDIFISTDRVDENAKHYNVSFHEELLRVMAHGILHLVGYGDKEEGEVIVMRSKEEEKMKLFHVEQK